MAILVIKLRLCILIIEEFFMFRLPGYKVKHNGSICMMPGALLIAIGLYISLRCFNKHPVCMCYIINNLIIWCIQPGCVVMDSVCEFIGYWHIRR